VKFLKQPTKIAFLLTSLVSGGEERTASVLARCMSQQKTLVFVFFNGPIDFEIPEEIEVKILRPNYAQRWLRLLTLPLVVWRYYCYCSQAGITHSISFDSLPNFSNCLLKMFGWKGKAYLRESNHVTTRFSAATLRGRLFHWCIRQLYPKADHLFVNAWRIAEDLQENYQLKIPMSLSLNPIDLPMIERLKAKAVPSNSQFTFIHVGMFRPQKNHILLLKAFAKIQHLPVQLWLVGRGVLEETLRQEIERLNLSEKVHFLGFTPNPYQYMARADCMVLSSDYEGLPNVLSEGLACGLPIISTDCPSGPREIIAPDSVSTRKTKDGIELVTYGILTPVGNADSLAQAMEYMVHQTTYRKSSFFKERVEEFRVEKVVEGLLEEMGEKNRV